MRYNEIGIYEIYLYMMRYKEIIRVRYIYNEIGVFVCVQGHAHVCLFMYIHI